MAGCCSIPARKLIIELTVLRVEGETCGRCTDTVTSVRIAAHELEAVLDPLNVTVELIESEAVADDLSDSNSVLINGRTVEEWIGAERVYTDCPGCGEMVGEPVTCGAISIEGSIEDSFSVEQIREAAFTALNEGAGTGCC